MALDARTAPVPSFALVTTSFDKLSKKQLASLTDALIDAFPSVREFQSLIALAGLLDRLGLNWSKPLRSAVLDAIQLLAAQGKLDALVESAIARRRDNAKLDAVVKSIAEASEKTSVRGSPPLRGLDHREEASADETAKKEQEAFYFVLRGPSARGNAIVARTAATLIFDYDVPPIDALISGRDPALDKARKTNADMFLVVTATGPLAVAAPIGHARFVNGKLEEPVRFEVKAGEEVGNASLQVGFMVRGELIHQTEISISVVARLPDASPADTKTRAEGMLGGKLQDIAVAPSPPPRQRIVLVISFAGGFLRLSLTDYRDGDVEFSADFQSTALDPTRVDTLFRAIHNDLKSCYEDEDFWSTFDGVLPEGEERELAVDALAQTLESVAAAGSRLNEELRADPRIAEALDYIEANGMQGAVLSVLTDATFLPWEFLYPEHRTTNMSDEERKADPVKPDKFWGARFAVETETRGIGSLTKLRDEHIKARPRVTINLNPAISIKKAAPDRQPLAVQRAWAKRLEERGMLDGIQDSCKDVRPVVQHGVKDSTLIYVYCHGSPPDAFSGTYESLVLDAKCSLEPRDLREKPPYRSAPIIFLNSCKGGVASPLRFSGFLKEFRARGALGLIATSYSVPIAFAASFGEQVVDRYLNRNGSLGAEMLGLRRRHLIEQGNPVPLFYTLQCHLDAAAA
jgi:hypothetical protein